MVRCYVTGVEFQLSEGFVLNRRAARERLRILKDQVASLQRVIDQLSPLDVEESCAAETHYQYTGIVRKKHRLVCKAIADAYASAFPELRLLLSWPEYQAQSQQRLKAKDAHYEVAAAPDRIEYEAPLQP